MAPSVENEVLDNIVRYEREARSYQQQHMDIDIPDAASLEERLERTIQELEERVKNRRNELARLQTHSVTAPKLPSADPKERLRQLHTIKLAYEQLSSTKPQLPSLQSPIPAIVAAKATRLAIAESRAAIDAAQNELVSAEHQAKFEEASLSDSKLLNATLEARMSRLQTAHQEKVSQPPDKAAQDLVRAKMSRRKDFQADCTKLRAALDEFIDEHLGAMIAAEELGGPVVGELMDIDDDMLLAGFSAQGRPKKSKAAETNTSDSKRQRRIDEIWGATSGDGPASEQAAASEEVKTLIGELLDAITGKSGSGIYVELERDSAAARFLVRSKVAQFHPKDARRLRIIDFGRELEE